MRRRPVWTPDFLTPPCFFRELAASFSTSLTPRGGPALDDDDDDDDDDGRCRCDCRRPLAYPHTSQSYAVGGLTRVHWTHDHSPSSCVAIWVCVTPCVCDGTCVCGRNTTSPSSSSTSVSPPASASASSSMVSPSASAATPSGTESCKGSLLSSSSPLPAHVEAAVAAAAAASRCSVPSSSPRARLLLLSICDSALRRPRFFSVPRVPWKLPLLLLLLLLLLPLLLSLPRPFSSRRPRPLPR